MAVYTDVSDEEMAAFVADYGIGELVSAKGIAEGVENSNYLIRTTGRDGTGDTFILTLYEKRVRPEDLPFFIGLMNHLSTKGIPCPQVVKMPDGTALRELCGRPAAVTTFLEGMWTRRIRKEHCGQVGAALAEFHKAGADFPMTRKNALTVDGWRPLFEMSEGRAHEVHPDMAPMIRDELAFLEESWPKDLPVGVCHADMFPDNVFFIGDRLSGLIDFYFACTDFLAYDLSICLNAWCFERDRSFNVTKARAMLSNYRDNRSVSEAELGALPILARGSALRFLLTRLYDWLNCPPGALVRPHDPMEYFDKLRFHQGVTGLGAYGLDGA